MEKIESYEQFSNILKAFKKEAGPLESNCYFIPSEVRYLTQKERLYLEKRDEGLYFFVKEANCDRLYYYLKAREMPRVEPHDRPILMDCVYRETEEDRKEQEFKKWEATGFTTYKKHRRMECMNGKFIAPADQEEKDKMYPLEALKPEDYPQCMALWEAGLDIYGTPFPDREEFERACEKEEIMGVRLADGSVGVVDRGIKKGRTAFMQHLVVSPKLRGIGLGRTLCCASIAAMYTRHGVEKVNFWVDAANSHAIEIYVRTGFVFDGMLSKQLKLEKKG